MSDALYDALSPILAASGLDLVDLEVRSGAVRVTVDREGGVDLDALAQVNRAVSAALDELDPIPGRYTLEVSSPGVERRLRTPAHFARALGETVSVRTVPGTAGVRRLLGRLAEADATGIVVEGPEVPGGSARLGYDEVERARTVFEWGPAPRRSGGATAKPGGNGSRVKKNAQTERVTTP
ncbi:MAG: ribosome maturation factor RimP [Acidimicrobiales bacterium]